VHVRLREPPTALPVQTHARRVSETRRDRRGDRYPKQRAPRRHQSTPIGSLRIHPQRCRLSPLRSDLTGSDGHGPEREERRAVGEQRACRVVRQRSARSVEDDIRMSFCCSHPNDDSPRLVSLAAAARWRFVRRLALVGPAPCRRAGVVRDPAHRHPSARRPRTTIRLHLVGPRWGGPGAVIGAAANGRARRSWPTRTRLPARVFAVDVLHR